MGLEQALKPDLSLKPGFKPNQSISPDTLHFCPQICICDVGGRGGVTRVSHGHCIHSLIWSWGSLSVHADAMRAGSAASNMDKGLLLYKMEKWLASAVQN